MQHVALEHGLILVDTKYEFGKGSDGTVLLIDEVGAFSLSLSLKSHYHEQIWCLCVNFRSILLIQVDIGLLILMRNALGTALNLKMLTRCVIYSVRSTCYSSSIPACAFMCYSGKVVWLPTSWDCIVFTYFYHRVDVF